MSSGASAGAGRGAGRGAGAGSGRSGEELDTRPLVVERKRLYFNVRHNARGRYLMIAEVNRAKRTTVIIPESGWVQMRDMLNEFIDTFKTDASAVPSSAPTPTPPPPVPSSQLWVENLPWSTTSEELRPMFEVWGTVTRCEALKNRKGLPRGVAIVRFTDDWGAKQALDNLNGTMCGDRPMRVRYDRFPQAPATAAKGSDESAPKGASRGDINVFVTDSAGTTVSLSVMPTGTVGDVLGVANGLKELRGGPRAGLVLDGVVLDPTSTLVDCAISDDTTLELVADTSAM